MLAQYIKQIASDRRWLILFVLLVGVLIIVAIGSFSMLTPSNIDNAEEEMITWEEAVEMVKSGSVVAVRLSHSKKATLIDNQNNTFVVKQPKTDELLNIIHELEPELQEKISVAIE
jgi:hypothetical protein